MWSLLSLRCGDFQRPTFGAVCGRRRDHNNNVNSRVLKNDKNAKMQNLFRALDCYFCKQLPMYRIETSLMVSSIFRGWWVAKMFQSIKGYQVAFLFILNLGFDGFCCQKTLYIGQKLVQIRGKLLQPRQCSLGCSIFSLFSSFLLSFSILCTNIIKTPEKKIQAIWRSFDPPTRPLKNPPPL